MACYSPMTGYRMRVANKNGKRSITFNKNLGYTDMKVTVPCGRCVGCLLERSRQWAVRCMHEASLYEDNCTLTLTYDDVNIPENGSLEIRDVQNFFKSFRRKYGKARYFICGEYGDRYIRPHYHILLFDFIPSDLVVRRQTDTGFTVYTSSTIGNIWNKGFHEIGSLTFESAAYAARYCTKKIYGKEANEIYAKMKKKPEFITMSKGIGKGHVMKYYKSIYYDDTVVVKGKRQKPPKYYDKILEELDKEKYDMIKIERLMSLEKAVEKYPLEFQMKRQMVKAELKRKKLKRLKRGLENGNDVYSV